MESYDKQLYAVLSGDLVRSGKLKSDELSSAKDCLKKAVGQLDKLPKDSDKLVKGTIDFYRGDGWQLLLTQPKYAFRACLFIRSYLKADTKADTRIAVGIGEVSLINEKSISQSIGKAFEVSGLALDKLKGRKRMTLACPYFMEDRFDSLSSVLELSDAIIQKWTQNQAEAISWALRGCKGIEISSKMKLKDKDGGTKHLRAAGWYAFESVLDRIEK